MMEPSSEPTSSGDASASPYWSRSREPLQILVFILPLVVFYEVGLLAITHLGGEVPRLLAYQGVEEAFDAMGLAAAGTALPAILIVVALLAWQGLSRRSWRVHWPTTLVMAAESVALAVPLLLLASLLVGGGAPPPAELVPSTSETTFLEGIVTSVGAGLYEEFVFRWILIAVVHTILKDGFKISNRTSTGIAVAVSSLLFMLAHEPSDVGHAVFFLGTGVFLSIIYVVRQFGIAVGTHAAYDVLVEVLGTAG